MRKSFLLLFISAPILAGCLSLQKPAPVTHYGNKTGAGSTGIHTVSGGETVWLVAKRYRLDMREIVELNHLRPPFALKSGMRLRLPPPHEYTARGDESLYEVSRLFGVSTSAIVRQNNLQAPYRLRRGQVIRLPSQHTAFAAASQSASVPVPWQPQTAIHAQGEPHIPVGQAPLPHRKPVLGDDPSRAGHTQTAVVSPLPAYQPPSYLDQPERTVPALQDSVQSLSIPKGSLSPGRFIRPVQGRVISGFGSKPGGLHNDGINIAAAKGTAVLAGNDGVVVYAGSELKGSGNLVLVRHEGRWMTAYGHLDKILVRRGQVLRAGQSVGTVGSTGSVSEPQLHFEVRRGTEAMDPSAHIVGRSG